MKCKEFQRRIKHDMLLKESNDVSRLYQDRGGGGGGGLAQHQHGVPTKVFLECSLLPESNKLVETPKSANLTAPFELTSILPACRVKKVNHVLA